MSFKYNAASSALLSRASLIADAAGAPGLVLAQARTKGLRSSYAKRQFLWQLRAALVFMPWLLWQQGG